MEIRGKTALITGGAHRVGRAITLALAQAGADVVINYRSSEDAARETAQEAQALGVAALAVQADLAQEQQVRALVATVEQQCGGVDVLVNSASRWVRTPLPAVNLDAWHQVIRVLLDGPFLLSNLLGPGMVARCEGAIINVLDHSINEPWRNYTAHSVGKSGLHALTRQLALELAPAVRVNGVLPGLVLPPPGYDEEQIARDASMTLLGRWGTPEDVADAVVFLARAPYITGEVLVVDGGARYASR